MNPDPFEALGLPARPDLPDEQVRAAWRADRRRHPPRPRRRRGPGPLHRRLRRLRRAAHPLGRSEAYADLIQQAELDGEPATGPLPAIPAGDAESAACRGIRWRRCGSSRPGSAAAAPAACSSAPSSPRCCPWWCFS